MDWLLRRLADRLGVAPAQAGEAITPRIQFEQPWSQGLLALVVLGSAALIIWLYRREGSAPTWYKMMLAAMRISLVLLAVFMLSEAVLSVERTGLPYFIIMADDSASARVVDQYGDPKAKAAAESLAGAGGKSPTQADRLAVAQGVLLKDDAALIRALDQQHKVKLYRVANDAVSLAEVDRPEDLKKAVAEIKALEPKGDQTRLGVALREVLTELRGVPPTAVLLLSDGQTTEGEPLSKAADLAKQKGVPIFAVGLGDPEPARDLELTDMLVDEVVFVDDFVRFEARLLSRGFANQPVTIRLKKRVAGSDRVDDLETITVAAPPDGQARRIEIGHRPKQTGEITFLLDVENKPRELQTDNNVVSRVVNVRKEKLKVLLIDGEPRYEYRYLKSFLERDRTIDLKVVLQSSDPEYAEQDPYALPQFPPLKDGPEGLFSYDVVILGDVDPGYLNAAQMKNLVEFVTQKGGGLLFVAGENFDPLGYKRTPLEPLLPILLNDARDPAGSAVLPAFRPVLTPEGASHPIFRFGDDVPSSRRIWKDLPELNWYFEAPKKQPAAFVLAAHPTAKAADGQPLPIILYQFNGAGKVMFNAVDDTWRWRYRVGDNGPFGRFWIQTIRFLARSKMLGQKQAEVTTDRKRYTRNQTVQIQVRFPNPGIAPASGAVTVDVKRKGGSPRKVALKLAPGSKNVFEGVLPQLPEGEYEAQLLPPPVLTGGLPSTAFRVDPPAGELERVQMNEPELRRAALATGGKFYTAQTLGTLLDDLPPPQKVPLDTDPPIAIWNTWPILLLFLTIAGMEWVFRKRKQMV